MVLYVPKSHFGIKAINPIAYYKCDPIAMAIEKETLKLVGISQKKTDKLSFPFVR